jgi:ATP/ADP translocase
MNTGITRDKFLAALAIALAAGALLCGYEFIRSVSQSLFIEAYGSKNLPVVMTLAPVGTLLLIYGYGRLLSAVGARRAILLTCLLSGIFILASCAAIKAGSRAATGFLYVFREAHIVLMVEQIWAFINSSFRSAECRKLNGAICGIASLGAIAGGGLVHLLAARLGSANLLFFAAASFAPTGLFAIAAYRFGGEPVPAPEEAGGRKGHLGGRLLLRERTLLLLALLIAATQVVATVLDLNLSRFVEQALPEVNQRTRWFGGFYAGLNLGSAFFQFILTPLLLHFTPLRRIHLGIPLVHLAACLGALLAPSLLTATLAYYLFKAIDYSVFRGAKELLYVPLSYDARYRSKELIDAFVYRLAKGGTSGILAGAGQFGALPLATYPSIALAALLAWLALAAGLTRPTERPLMIRH